MQRRGGDKRKKKRAEPVFTETSSALVADNAHGLSDLHLHAKLMMSP